MSRLPAPWIAWTVALASIALALVPAALSAARAAERASVAAARLEQARAHVTAIGSTRAALPATTSQGLAEAAIAALAAAGLPAGSLESLTPDAGSISAGPVERRRATMSLRCTLPETGKLMDVWPRLVPGWTITAADLSPNHQAGREATAHTPGPVPLRVILTLEGVFAREDGA